MSEPEHKTIRIDNDLYLRLREHCDRDGVRFLDFLENALEDALLRETVTKAMEAEIEILRKKAVKYDYAFNRGFQQGFAFFYQMMEGLGFSADAEEDLNIVKQFPSENPRGEQLQLF
jgi:hypothetical protein